MKVEKWLFLGTTTLTAVSTKNVCLLLAYNKVVETLAEFHFSFFSLMLNSCGTG